MQTWRKPTERDPFSEPKSKGKERKIELRNRVCEQFDEKMMMMGLYWRKTGGLNSSFVHLPLFVAFY